jgi:gamma-glutamylcyclotransferase (GGCT)/AIG2-like uncharacterized protein YtfP
MVEYLFVYGTLRSAFSNRYALLLSRQGTLLGLAQVRGRLYDLGRYPAFAASNGHDHWVEGEIFALRNSAPLLAALDAYEGPAYRRVRTQATLDERRLTAWVYEYRRELPWWRRIPSGDFLARRP